jgi:hypothetical protein
MQKRHIVLHFLDPAAPVHPTVRPFHHPPPGPAPRFLLQRCGLFPPRADVGGKAALGEQVTDRVIAIASVQAHPLGGVRGRLRPHDGYAGEGCLHQRAGVPRRPLHRVAQSEDRQDT